MLSWMIISGLVNGEKESYCKYGKIKEVRMIQRYLGIDIGASSIKYGIGDSKQGLQYFASIRLQSKDRATFSRIFEDIFAEAADWDLAGIGIGSPGTISQPEAIIRGVNPNIPFLSGMSPKELVPAELDLPIFVDNDANLMTLAEAEYYKAESCMGVTVGSGIGSGMVLDGQIYHGSHGYAAELGHCNMVPGGEPCSCGQHGCLEAYSSVDGIYRRLRAQGSLYANRLLPELIERRSDVNELDKIISEGEEVLIRALANLVIVMDPELIVLGGGGMELGLYNINRIREAVGHLLPQAHRETFRCELAGYGNRSGVMGGIILCERNLI